MVTNTNNKEYMMGKQRKAKRRRAMVAARSSTVMLNDTQKKIEDTFGGKTITITPEPTADIVSVAPDATITVAPDAPVKDENGKVVGKITDSTVKPSFMDRLKGAYREASPIGLTTADIVVLFPDVARSSITGRISDLKKQGLVIPASNGSYAWAGE